MTQHTKKYKELEARVKAAEKTNNEAAKECSRIIDIKRNSKFALEKAKEDLDEFRTDRLTSAQIKKELAKGKLVKLHHWDRSVLMQVDNIRFPGMKNKSILLQVTSFEYDEPHKVCQYNNYFPPEKKEWVVVDEGNK